MTEAMTLLQMAKVPTHPSSLDQSVILLIDHQKEYSEGALKLVGIDAAMAQMLKLLDLARIQEVPIIHIQHQGKPGGLFDVTGEGGSFMAGLEPKETETVIGKNLPNAFAGTNLHATLQKLNRKELIIGGFMTHMCVSATARSALDHGYRSTLVASATATRDLPDCDGGLVRAKDLQRASLAALADRFCIVVPDVTVWH